MNIDEIRAEIPKAFSVEFYEREAWIKANGKPDYKSEGRGFYYRDTVTAARMIVDMAHEAGKATGYQNGWDFGYAEGVEASENYKRGFEAGKAADSDCPNCEKVGYEMGYEAAAKDPKAWYVLGANNLPIHIGDTVKSTDPELDNEWDYEEVTGFNFRFDRPQLEYRLGHDYADEMVKVTPDSWEKIQEDLFHRFTNEGYKAFDAEEVASGFINRAKKLAEVD